MKEKIKKARVFIKKNKNKEWFYVLVGGEKGRGKELYKCKFWMDQGGDSESMAENYCIDQALKLGIDTLYVEVDEDQYDHILYRKGDVFVDSPDCPHCFG